MGRGETAQPRASSARSARPARCARTTSPCRGCTGAGSSFRTARWPTCCWRHPEQLRALGLLMAAHVRPRAGGLLGAAHGAALVRGARRVGCRPCGGSWSRPGERFWKRLWRPLYDGLEGNPFAAMPSLHFGTSVMAARVLSEVGRGTGALGWALRAHAGLRPGVPRGALRDRPDRRASRWPRGSGAAAPHAPAGAGRGRAGDPAAGARGGLMTADERRPRAAGRRRPEPRRRSRWTTTSSADEEEDLRGLGHCCPDRRQLVTLAVVFVAAWRHLLVFPKVVGLDDALERDRRRHLVLGRGRGRASTSRPSPPTWRSSAGSSAAARTSEVQRAPGLARPRTRSPWPGWRPRGSSRPAARAGSCSPTGRCARPGMPRRRSACRMVAFLVLIYSVYLLALVVFGVLLRTGVLPGDNPVGGTIVPAAIAGGAIVLLGLVALIPGDFERRLRESRAATGASRVAQQLATGAGHARHGRAHRHRLHAPPEPRSARRVRRGGLLGGQHRRSCGPASRPSGPTCRSACWSRASSWAWPPT